MSYSLIHALNSSQWYTCICLNSLHLLPPSLHITLKVGLTSLHYNVLINFHHVDVILHFEEPNVHNLVIVKFPSLASLKAIFIQMSFLLWTFLLTHIKRVNCSTMKCINLVLSWLTSHSLGLKDFTWSYQSSYTFWMYWFGSFG